MILTMASTSLIAFPVEILIMITSYLDQPNHGAFRLTCRGIEDALFRDFAQKYFSKIMFMRTEFSLQGLVDISKSRLSSYVQHVVISTQVLNPQLGRIIHRPPEDKWEKGSLKFNQLCAEQTVLLDTSHDQQLLIEAFSNLNLQVIGVWEPPYTFARNPPSYGMSHLLRETFVDASRDGNVGNAPTRRRTNANCLHNILFALGKSGSRPVRFEIEMLEAEFGDESFNIPGFMSKSVFPVLSGLEAVEIRLERISTGRMRPVATMGGPAPGYMLDTLETSHLRRFLLQSVNIKHLRLENLGQFDGFWRWIAAKQPHEGGNKSIATGLDNPPPAFKELCELELGHLNLHFHDFLAILKKFSKTLRKLSLRAMTLTLPTLSKTDTFFDEWPELMTSLARHGRRLEEVHFDTVDIMSGHSARPLIFKASRSFSYAGPNMENMLGGMVDALSTVTEDDNSLGSGSGSGSSFADDDPDEYDFDASDGNDLEDFEEYLGYVEEYDNLLDGFDPTEEDLMFEAIFGA
ncbi:hypothetical protein F4804DRAFT_310341 [Jackrogersella minutella]|nr:hypothetical protein F4804DRAFT_310341 [Jackrogersella minutella]